MRSTAGRVPWMSAGGEPRMDVESARKEVHPEEAPESERLLAVLDDAVACP